MNHTARGESASAGDELASGEPLSKRVNVNPNDLEFERVQIDSVERRYAQPLHLEWLQSIWAKVGLAAGQCTSFNDRLPFVSPRCAFTPRPLPTLKPAFNILYQTTRWACITYDPSWNFGATAVYILDTVSHWNHVVRDSIHHSSKRRMPESSQTTVA